MEYYNNILCVDASWLISEGIISKSNYDKLSNTKDLQIIRRGCRGVTALVSYESMPERFKREVDARVDVRKAVQENLIEQAIAHDGEASAYYDEYRIDEYRSLPPKRRREYYTNAIILDAIHRVIETKKSWCRSKRKAFSRFWDRISEAVNELDPAKYPHSLPENERSLERRYKEYLEGGYEILIHKNYRAGHKNAAKIKDDVQESAMAMLVSDPRNLDDVQVSRLYNMLSEQMGWNKISSSTVAVWRDKLDSDIYARRHGVKKHRDNKAMQVKRAAPKTALTYWCLDGWDVELLYQKEVIGKDGKRKVTYHNRLTCVFVIDVCNKYPIGYAIGDSESGELIKEALRNAAQHTEQLFGQMYRTTQIQCDNYARKAMWDTYELMAHYVTPAAVGNAKSKVVEPWFRYFNKKYCQLLPNWSGHGVTARKENQPNVDFLNKHKKDFPTLEQAIMQVTTAITKERFELYDDYVKRYEATPMERKLPLPYEQYLLHYGARTGYRNMLQGSGLKVTIEGVKRDYDCFNPEFRRHASEKWEVCYDPDDKRQALAVSEDGRMQFLLEEKYVQPMALVDRQEGDYEQLERVWGYNKQQAEETANRISAHQETFTALVEGRKELDTLIKLLLVDSGGQHKDNRNAARLKRKRTVPVEAEIIGEVVDSEGNMYDDY